MAEALAHGTMGGFYGLLFGFLIAQVMILAMNLKIGYNFSLQPFVIGVLIAFLVAQIAALGPARRAAQVNIIEAIKHESRWFSPK